MGKSLLEQQQLAKQIADSKQQITLGALYRHYKSDRKIYKVLGLGFIEATNELCVMYQAQYEEQLTFIRPLDVWLQEVEWNGQKLKRFTKV